MSEKVSEKASEKVSEKVNEKAGERGKKIPNRRGDALPIDGFGLAVDGKIKSHHITSEAALKAGLEINCRYSFATTTSIKLSRSSKRRCNAKAFFAS